MAKIIAVCRSENKGTIKQDIKEGVFARVINGGFVRTEDSIGIKEDGN